MSSLGGSRRGWTANSSPASGADPFLPVPAQPGAREVGFWGSFVVARTVGTMLDLEAVTDLSEGVIFEEKHGSWLIGQFEDNEVAEASAELLPELVDVTRAPALTALVFGSSAAFVFGFSPLQGMWAVVIAPDAMRAHFEDSSLQFHPAQVAAEKASGWAREAGLEPDEQALVEVFAAPRGVPVVEPLFYQALTAMGLTMSSEVSKD